MDKEKNIPSLPPELEKMLKACTNLPSLPSVAVHIINASKDPDIGLGEVATIISSDPAIAAKLLRVANSPLYSQRRTVTNLREALTLLGFNAALTISLSFSLLQSFKSSENERCNHENFWKRSILSAEIARLLASRLKLAKIEDLFLASLLQDVGILVLEKINPSPYKKNYKECIKHQERITLEKDFMEVDHAHVGAWLLQSWHFPEKIVNAVCWSHSLSNGILEKDKVDYYFCSCLSIAGNLADIWLDEGSHELLEATIESAQLFLNINKDEFKILIKDINNELEAISSIFEVDLLDEMERGRMLDEAREILLDRSIYYIKQSEDDRRQIESIAEQVRFIEKESQLDHLTQVYNRKHIDQILLDEYENSNINRWPLSLAFIDVDNFKMVNDLYGHSAGDKVLISIADFFLNNIRQTDCLARYGGDEFILMLPGSTSEIAQGMLGRLVNSLGQQLCIKFEDKLIKTTVSIGLASHMDNNDFDTLKDFIRAADKALYKAKSEGRNCLSVY